MAPSAARVYGIPQQARVDSRHLEVQHLTNDKAANGGSSQKAKAPRPQRQRHESQSHHQR